MSGKLYIVGTPIGNLNDFSPRAVATLESVDFIAAEDTRVSLKLLNHFDIKKELISYYEHNKHEKGKYVIDRILNGENCAIVTDAGMPAISDPGEDLVRMCHEYGIKVESVPGPTAFATALALSGMDARRFTFEGFLSVHNKERREHLESVANERRTMIFYEAPHKLTNTLNDLYKYLGDRELSIVREITKIHEQVIKTTLKEASEKYSSEKLKGEIVLVIAGKKEELNDDLSLDDAINMAKKLVDGGMSVNMAAKEIANSTPFKKSDIYKALL